MKGEKRLGVTSVTSVTSFCVIDLYARARLRDQRKKASQSSRSSQPSKTASSWACSPLSRSGHIGPIFNGRGPF